MTPRTIYVILQIVGIVILVFESLYVALQKPSTLQKHLIFILLTVIISFIGYLIELIGSNLESAYIGCCIGYAGKPFALMASMLLLLDYSNIKTNKWIVIGVTLFLVFLTIMVFTNQYHHLYYKQVAYREENIGSPLTIVERGPFWYVYMASSFILFGGYCVIAGREFMYAKNKQAKHMAVLLFFVVFFSILGLILYIAGVTYAYDTTLFGILIGVFILLILLIKYRLFDSLSLAQHKALNDSGDGIVILDARMTISYSNATAQKLFPDLAKLYSRKKEQSILAEVEKNHEGDIIFHDNKIYQVKITESTVGRHNKVVGKSYIFNDITTHHNYQEQLSKDVDSAKKKILKIQRNALVSLANIVEARDGNTGEHVKNVSYVARLIAQQLMFDSEYKDLITVESINILDECAPLHDLGKIYIPDAILRKPGKLTPEEFEIMKTHTTKGLEIINTSIKGIEEPRYLKIACDIAYCHHEWWNGNGYPRGLKGKKIPLSARIIAIADVYDALRMKRTYKDSYSKEKSVEIILSESGTHFDPEIVKAFLAITNNLK